MPILSGLVGQVSILGVSHWIIRNCPIKPLVHQVMRLFSWQIVVLQNCRGCSYSFPPLGAWASDVAMSGLGLWIIASAFKAHAASLGYSPLLSPFHIQLIAFLKIFNLLVLLKTTLLETKHWPWYILDWSWKAFFILFLLVIQELPQLIALCFFLFITFHHLISYI